MSKSKWIPCDERMPDPSEGGKNFLVTVSKICSYNNGIDYYQKEERWVTIEQFFFVDGDAHFFRAWYDKSKIIAWMPLAEPFNDGRMETEHLSKCPKCGEYTSVKSGACEYCGEKMRVEDEQVH